MGKFNTNTKGINKTTNLAGGESYKINDLRLKVALGVMTNFVNEPKFYGNNTNQLLNDIRGLISVDPRFVANLTVYTRKEMYMRSITHMLIAELAHDNRGKAYVRQVCNEAIQRVDDMTEVLAYYLKTYGKPIPNSLKKGLADAFWKFDEYQLSKYNRDGSVTLKDLILLCHPRCKNEQQATLIKKILDGNLSVPCTWETQLSAQDGRTKAEKWTSLVLDRKLGYMAMLRNLRGILESGVSQATIDVVINYLTNENAVKNSKQFPYRFLSAYRELQHNNCSTVKLLNAIENALAISVNNLPKLDGTTFFTADYSQSMEWGGISANSKVTMKDIAGLFMSIGDRFCENSLTSIFATSFKMVQADPFKGIIANIKDFEANRVGGSTNLYKSIEYLLENKIYVDRIVIFSDMQVYGGSTQSYLDRYKREINPNVWVHSINLAGYGTSQFSTNKKTNLLAGFSDKTLGLIKMTEDGIDSLVNKIDNYIFS